MFRLLRYFSLASLASMVVAAFLLGALYRHVALGNLLEMGERGNVALARTLANALRSDFDPLVGHDAGAMDSVQLAVVMDRLNTRVVEYTRGMSVVKVKIYDLRGKTVFSSDPKQIGEDKQANPGFQSALSGQPLSELSHRDQFSAFEQSIDNRDLLSSYVPVAHGKPPVVDAVFEVYDDVTPLLAQLAATQMQVVAGVLLVLACLYGVLFAIVRHADRILQTQRADLLRHEDEQQRARETLEQRVLDRTTALQEMNAKLNAEVLQRREAERELTQARRIAESASNAKSQFLSVMSHEIRTPINGVLGMTELLQHTPLDADQTRYVGAILSAGRLLHGLLSDILDLSKIEEGQLELERIDFDLSALLLEAVDVYRGPASSRGLLLLADSVDQVGRVNGDPGRLRQVLGNLLGNAVKFTQRGQVRMHTESLPARAGDARAWRRFSVEDTGRGIDARALDRLFQRFVQADTSTTREFGGSGLGLVICRHLVELMGGSIHVRSEPGKGSRFWFDIPMRAPMQAQAQVSGPVASRRLRRVNASVLVAEDNLVNQEVIKGLLGHLGVRVAVAGNGVLALEQVRRQVFDLVFMDCQMPVMDGFEATRRIRQWEREQPGRTPLPIIALTANALSGDREACLAAGMNDYVAKPVSIASLSRALECHLMAGAYAIDSIAPALQDRADAALAEAPDFDASVVGSLPMVADGSEPGFAGQLFGMFVDGAAPALAAIEQAMREGDRHQLTRLLHSFKSGAAQVGAKALAAQAERQERVLRGGGVAAADFASRLRASFERFEQALARHRQPAGADTDQVE